MEALILYIYIYCDVLIPHHNYAYEIEVYYTLRSAFSKVAKQCATPGYNINFRIRLIFSEVVYFRFLFFSFVRQLSQGLLHSSENQEKKQKH